MIIIEKKKIFGREGVKEFKKSFILTEKKEKEDAMKEILKCINEFLKYLSTNSFELQAWEKEWIKELELMEKEVYELYLKDYFYIIEIK